MTDHGKHPLGPLFNPRSVAVFGASDRASSVGAQVFKKLVSSAFEGAVHAVNSKYASVQGHPCFPDIATIGTPVDLALIATPAPAVPGIIAECADAGTHHAIVLSAGFGEGSGGGHGQELSRVITERGVRVLGPNCVGLVRPWLDFDATFLKGATPRGGLALVSQSGALCSAISDWAGPNHLGFSALVSLGNAMDLGFGEVVEFLANDSKTEAILLYVEGVRDGRRFISSLRYATSRKPVVVLKGGRGSEAARAASTHSGSLMGSDDVFNAALARTGAVRAFTFGQLFAAAEILGSVKRAGGNRLCIVTNGGGAGVLAADRAEDLGLSLPSPSADTVARLDAELSRFWSRSNPIDVLGDATAAQFGGAVARALDDGAYDGVIAMLTPQSMTDTMACATAVIDAAQARPARPVIACWMGETSVREARIALSSAGIPDFTTPERAIEAFFLLAQHHRHQELAAEVPTPRARDRSRHNTAHEIIGAALAEGRTMLNAIESGAILEDFGIPAVRPRLARSSGEAETLASEIAAPLAMKIFSPGISHKSDIDGVRLNVATPADAARTFDDLVRRAAHHRPDARIEGVTLEAMARLPDSRELLVGVSRDPVFGAAILFGLGGTQVEVLRDRAMALPPLTDVVARRLIAETRADRLLDRFRNLGPVDRNALIDVLLRISDLVCACPEIVELDVNPLLASPGGILAVDARIVVAEPDDGAPHLVVTA